MDKTKERGLPEYNRNYNLGDIVSVIGDETKIYRIVCYKEVHEVNEDEPPMGYTEYILTDVDSAEDWWDVAYDEDIMLLAVAEEAAKFLRNRQARAQRRRKGGKKTLTVDDLLSDLHSFIKLRDSLPNGQVRDAMEEMVTNVKVALQKKTGGGR